MQQTSIKEAVEWVTQQMLYVKDEDNEATFCFNTFDELIVTLQKFVGEEADTQTYKEIIANMRYSNDEVNESKYL